MTILNMELASFAPLSDLSGVLLICQSDESHTESSPVAVRTYANGRRRVISTPGGMESVSLSFGKLSRADYAALTALKGTPVLFRDQRQRRVFGVFASITGNEVANRPDWVFDVSVTIEEISYSEIVT